MPDSCARLAKAIEAYIAKENDDLKDSLDKEGYLDAKGTVDEAESIEEELADVMNYDTQNVADQLAKTDSVENFVADTWEMIKQGSALADDIQEIIQDGLNRIIPKLVNAYLQETDMYLVADKIGSSTTNWIQKWSGELGSLMKLTSHDQLGGILSDALSAGKSVAEVTRNIMDAGIRDNYTRARATAITEMLTAHSVSRNEGLMQSPAVESKEWRHSGGFRIKPRPNHVAMDGVVVPKSEPFALRGADGNTYYPQYPRDTNLPARERINCHCLHRGIVNDNVLGLSLDERKKLQQQAIDADDEKWKGDLDEENKRKAGIDDPKLAVNSLLPNANYGTVKPTKRYTAKSYPSTKSTPNDIVDYTDRNGTISRFFYDDNGDVAVRVDCDDHGVSSKHPYGSGGAHYVRYYVQDGEASPTESTRLAATAKMRRLCKDIIGG